MISKSAALLMIGLILGLAGGRWLAGHDLPGLGLGAAPGTGADEGDMAAGKAEDGDREVLYWYDPMYPGTRFDKPGKSPFMDMDLSPRYADSDGGEGVRIDPAQVQNLGLKTAPATRGRLTRVRDVPANVEFNRYQEARVQPRAEGFVTRITRLAEGDRIEAGEEIASVTVPAWASDQSEFLLLKSQRADQRLISGVREKLRLNGMPEEMLAEVESSGKVQTSLRILAPVSGVITSLDVYPGMNADKNMTLAVIQGTDPVWVTAEVPESDLGLALSGKARLTAAAWPGEVFEVTGQTVLAKAKAETRTVTLRLTAPNPDGRLRPGLTASVRLRGPGPEGLLIPTQSLIDLGDEKRVITRTGDGAFLPKLVATAGDSGGQTVVTRGLDEGDLVVVSGLFLIDSEANLTGALERMRRPGPPGPAAAGDGTDGPGPGEAASSPTTGG
jgi:Cu(I)/Ag(I) efflux system membrane fusion protein